MNGLGYGTLSFIALMLLEAVTYPLVQFSPFGAVVLAALVSLFAGCVYADRRAALGARAARNRALLVAGLPLVPLAVWAGLVWRGVRTVEAEMQFARIPQGCFMMGSDERGPGIFFEGPTHNVCLKAFDLGVHEVTQAEWRQVMFFPNDPDPTDPLVKSFAEGRPDMLRQLKELKGDPLPVGYLSWDDARRFARLISLFGHGHYRLPTEAEWEYAARAGTTGPYYWGPDTKEACTYENVSLTPTGKDPAKLRFGDFAHCDNGFRGPAPVGSFKPNPWGLYDMLGNVSEWVEDCWVNSYRDTPTDGAAFEQPGCEYRVLRGGTWSTGDWGVNSFRVTARTNNLPYRLVTYTSTGDGMRLARSPDD
ncbi:MAG TPA: SUMF1/EgtB/PvdO family nonheme iron enzyme [Stellaceae bacterium]|jgi:formylglycine-generating enzyme required for sulfatase activity|nr:SUMF1/EgtB/PvdO family nonheme iron enzyme [Stellaceae bacterium]